MKSYLKIFLLILFINIPIKSQAVEFSAVGYSVLSGLTMYNQMMDRENYQNGNPVYKTYSENWHTLQTLETLSLINYGIQIEAVNNSDWLKNSVDVLFLGSVRWIVRDGVYQLLQGNNFFYQSPK